MVLVAQRWMIANKKNEREWLSYDMIYHRPPPSYIGSFQRRGVSHTTAHHFQLARVARAEKDRERQQRLPHPRRNSSEQWLGGLILDENKKREQHLRKPAVIQHRLLLYHHTTHMLEGRDTHDIRDAHEQYFLTGRNPTTTKKYS